MAGTKIMAKIPKEKGVEVHVRQTSGGGNTYIDIRDFYPESGEYGRGTVLPASLLSRLIESLNDVESIVGNARSTAGEIEGQLTLPGMANV